METHLRFAGVGHDRAHGVRCETTTSVEGTYRVTGETKPPTQGGGERRRRTRNGRHAHPPVRPLGERTVAGVVDVRNGSAEQALGQKQRGRGQRRWR